MIKRTMQEWADFFDCYIAKNGNSGNCFKDDIMVFEKKPYLIDNETWWASGKSDILCKVRDDDDIIIPNFELMDMQELREHDWRVLVEPKNKGVEGDD